jgi:ribonucleoside-diphosphate reductase alpha chain
MSASPEKARYGQSMPDWVIYATDPTTSAPSESASRPDLRAWVGGLKYAATVGRFSDGRIAEIFLSNHKSNSAADVNARDAAIACSIALQFGADVETICRALSRDSHGRATGPLGAALDRIGDG